MKKILSLAVMLCIILSACALCASAGIGTVGISMPTRTLERWNRDGSYLKEQFEAAGYQVILQYSDNDIDRQNTDIAGIIAQGVDILIVSPIDGDSLQDTLAAAKKAGIPVISYDRMITSSDAVDYYVSFDNYEVGVLQAQYIINTFDLDNAGNGKTFNIEFTAGDPGDNNAGFFFGGAYDTLLPYIDAGTLRVPSGRTSFEDCATPLWLTKTAYASFSDRLDTYYSDGTVLDIALCSNDSTAAGVCMAIQNSYKGANKPVVTGQDGDISNLQYIVDGVQTMTVYKNVSDEAGVTLVLAQALLNGDSIDENLCAQFDVEAAFNTEDYSNGTQAVTSFLLVPYSIDASNLDLLVETGNYKWDANHQYLVSTAV